MKTKNKRLFTKIYQKLNLKEKCKQLTYPKKYLSGTLLLLLFTLTFLWYSQLTESSENLADFTYQTVKNMGEIFKEEVREGGIISSQWNIFYKQKDPTPLLQNYTKEVTSRYRNKQSINPYPQENYIGYKPRITYSKVVPLKISPSIASKVYLFREINKKLVKIFIIVGVLSLLFTQLREKRINSEYIIMTLVGIFWLGAIMVLPFASISYNLMRTYQQMLVILSLPAVLGGMTIFKFLKQNIKVFIVLIIFISYFLFISNLIPQIIGGSEASMQLNNFGSSYDQLYVHKTEIKSADWLFDNRDNEELIYAAERATYKLWLSNNINKDKIIENVLPSIIDQKAYVYSSYTNTIERRAFTYTGGKIISYNFPAEFLNQNKNKIYFNGGSEIFK